MKPSFSARDLHRCKGLSCRLIEWYHPMAALVLAARDPNHALNQVHVSPLQVLYFNWPEGGIRSHNCREIDRLPLGIAAGNFQESVLFFVGQSTANRLTLSPAVA